MSKPLHIQSAATNEPLKPGGWSQQNVCSTPRTYRVLISTLYKRKDGRNLGGRNPKQLVLRKRWSLIKVGITDTR